MVHEIEAVYENGVLRPLTPVSLTESATVHVRISTSAEDMLDVALVERARTQLEGRPIPTIEEIQIAAASIPGNWSDDIIAERGEF